MMAPEVTREVARIRPPDPRPDFGYGERSVLQQRARPIEPEEPKILDRGDANIVAKQVREPGWRKANRSS